MKLFRLLILSSLALSIQLSLVLAEVHMANGIKIGEVDSDSAIIWTRLTQTPEGLRPGVSFIALKKLNVRKTAPGYDGMDQLPEGKTLAEMEGAVPGVAGEVRLTYWPENAEEQKIDTGWHPVDAHRDYTRQFQITQLQPGTRYHILIKGRPLSGDSAASVLEGSFMTAPLADEVIDICGVITTCGDYERMDDDLNGHTIYQTILDQIKPHFFVHAGDIEYYDKPNPWAPSRDLARFKMTRLYAMPFNRKLHRYTASYFMKDDHDITKNDAWPGQNFGALTWEIGLDVFAEQFPVGEQPYRTVRWGKDLQIWMLEGREYRSPNNLPDGPEKTILGQKQKQWLFDTVKESDATFKVLISSTPIVGPDRKNKKDNHANLVFQHEGDELRRFISKQKNLFVANGDRHWQYHAIDEETGVHEFSCGPHSDQHAGGFSADMKTAEHQFLRIKGGFLSVQVSRQSGQPQISFQHHDVQGKVVNEAVFFQETR
ncbi:MAG: alkaline phosphatase D family protein [Verrucomicrobiota bacterium]